MGVRSARGRPHPTREVLASANSQLARMRTRSRWPLVASTVAAKGTCSRSAAWQSDREGGCLSARQPARGVPTFRTRSPSPRRERALRYAVRTRATRARARDPVRVSSTLRTQVDMPKSKNRTLQSTNCELRNFMSCNSAAVGAAGKSGDRHSRARTTSFWCQMGRVCTP